MNKELALASIHAQSEKLVQDMFGILFYNMIGDDKQSIEHFRTGMKLLLKAEIDAKLVLDEIFGP